MNLCWFPSVFVGKYVFTMAYLCLPSLLSVSINASSSVVVSTVADDVKFI